MPSFQESLQIPASKKLVFVDIEFLKHFFGWVPDSGVWQQASSETVIKMTENGVDADEKADKAAVIAATTTTVGAWAYDSGFLVYKPKAGTTVFENFVVATLNVKYDKFGEDFSGDNYSARVVSVPKLNLKTSQVFSNKLAQTGAGGIKLNDADAFFSRTDIEPDGIAKVNTVIET